MGKGIKQKVILTIFVIGLVGVGFALGQFQLNRTFQQQVEMGYRRALNEFVFHTNELRKQLGLARVATSLTQKQLIASNIRRLVYAIQSNMGELPLGEIQLERVAYLMNQIYGQTYTGWEDDQQQELGHMYQQMEYLSTGLQELLASKELEFPWVSWHEYLATSAVVPNFLQALVTINDGLDELRMPVRTGEIVGAEVEREEAVRIAEDFTRRPLNFQITNESKGAIPTYTAEAKDGADSIIVEVSQKGGVVLWMTSTKEVTESRLDLDSMIEHAREFLREREFPPLHLTDAQVLRHRATLTFVPIRAGVLHYAEPLKVQISAFDGSVLGFWGTPFYLAESRGKQVTEAASEVSWTLADKIRQDAKVLDQKQAWISTPVQKNVLTQRLGVHYQDEYFLIYLNAQTGEEELIVPVSSPEYF